MLIWYDPEINAPGSEWVWVQSEQRIMHWIAAEPRMVSVPSGPDFDHIAAAAKEVKVKCQRH